jgi:acetyl-CoA carboxylase biotin carboxylase subunit
MREEIGNTLVRCLKDIGYQNAGTIEFLMDEDGKLYFIEMNTRIQVEHPVTEFITGIDLVKAQLRIAAGEKLSMQFFPPNSKSAATPSSAASMPSIPKFTPSAGKITAFNVPGGNGVRVDTAQYAEGVVPPYYDSLIAKLICYGDDRAEAIARMERALSQFVVQGIDTSIPLHQAIFRDEDFRTGKFDTKFMERFLAKSGMAVRDRGAPPPPLSLLAKESITSVRKPSNGVAEDYATLCRTARQHNCSTKNNCDC